MLYKSKLLGEGREGHRNKSSRDDWGIYLDSWETRFGGAEYIKCMDEHAVVGFLNRLIDTCLKVPGARSPSYRSTESQRCDTRRDGVSTVSPSVETSKRRNLSGRVFRT